MWVSSFDCAPPSLRERPPPRTMPVMSCATFSLGAEVTGLGVLGWVLVWSLCSDQLVWSMRVLLSWLSPSA